MKFSMSDAWRDATAMMSANREVLLVIAGIFFLLPSLATVFAMPGIQEAMLNDPAVASDALMDIYASWWWLLVIVMLAQLIGYLAMLALLRDTARPTVGEALRTGLGGMLTAIGMYLVLGVAALAVALVLGLLTTVSAGLGLVAILAGVIAGIYVMVKLSLAMAAIAIEKITSPIGAIRRSWQLTKGNSLRLFLFYLLLVIVYLVISTVLAAVLGLLFALFGTSTAMVLNGLVSSILSCVLTVVFVAVIAAVHRQLAGPSAQAVSATFD
jgi:membrane-anchored glycerophosphoryl diester phosphodiesterase (GDPDase)